MESLFANHLFQLLVHGVNKEERALLLQLYLRGVTVKDALWVSLLTPLPMIIITVVSLPTLTPKEGGAVSTGRIWTRHV